MVSVPYSSWQRWNGGGRLVHVAPSIDRYRLVVWLGDVESLYPRIILAEVEPDLVKQRIRVCKGC
jgi:hypothetical protein